MSILVRGVLPRGRPLQARAASAAVADGQRSLGAAGKPPLRRHSLASHACYMLIVVAA
jgi:hypothetical protein